MKSLAQRLTLTHVIVAVLAVIVAVGLASILVVQAYERYANEQTDIIQQRLSQGLAQIYGVDGSWANLETMLRATPTFTEGLNIPTGIIPNQPRMVVANGQWLVIWDNGTVNNLKGKPLPALLRRRSTEIRMQGEQAAAGYVVIPRGLLDGVVDDAERNFVRSMIWIVIIGSLLACGFAALVAANLSQRLAQPIVTLTSAVQRVASGDRSQRLIPPKERELADLTQSFNRMADQLDQQEQIRRQFVADIAHEFRTPLSVMRLQVESLQDGITPATPEAFSSIEQEITLLARLVDDLRLLSITDAGQLSLKLEKLDAQALSEQVVTGMLPRARQQSIAIQIEVEPGLLPVYADAQRLAQVLGNLLENALRYSAPQSQIVLRLRAVDIRNQAHFAPPAGFMLYTPLHHAIDQYAAQARSTQRVLFEVIDSGPGIPNDDLPHVFERFFRADRARARETGGSGLGLAIVQRLVEAQHGEVSVLSAPGQGTMFRVLMPAVSAE